jgi:dTDP-4-amino-4,6-dideoxygalactose transaminase
LSAALLALGAKPGTRCLLPSWTFVASAAAVWAAHLRPHFVDVSPDTWMLDPLVLRQRDDLADVGAVMVVSAFGAPIDMSSWDAFTAATGVPVIVDAAASFDAVSSVPISQPTSTPAMISFHATKAFGIGEGALVISRDEHFASRVREFCNFGFCQGLESERLGYNGKLSEYHAAVGLCALDVWAERRAALMELTRAYSDDLNAIEAVGLLPGFGAGWVSCYCNVRLDGDAQRIADGLHADGIETRRWWRRGVHRQPAYAAEFRDALPVTEQLAEQVLALPFFHDLSLDQRDRVVRSLSNSLAHA